VEGALEECSVEKGVFPHEGRGPTPEIFSDFCVKMTYFSAFLIVF